MKKFLSKKTRAFITRQICFITAVVTIGFASCKKAIVLSGDEGKLTSVEKSAHGMPHIVVKTGCSIQAAVNSGFFGFFSGLVKFKIIPKHINHVYKIVEISESSCP